MSNTPFAPKLRDPPDEECRHCLALILDAAENLFKAQKDFGVKGMEAFNANDTAVLSEKLRRQRYCARDCWLKPARMVHVD